MARRAVPLGLILGAIACALVGHPPAARAQTQEDPRVSAAYLQGLRDRGYYDLAGEYLVRLSQQPDAPAGLKETLDYELGRVLLDEASHTNDLVRRRELFDKARVKLEAFTKAHADHAKAPDALVQLARLLAERGSLAMLRVDDTEEAAEKESLRAEARRQFGQARQAYETAEKALAAAVAKFPISMPESDPRRAERERTQASLMDAQLQRGIVDYEEGLTYPVGAKERADLMSKALAHFEGLYKSYRTQFAGLAARMWQAKCFEERGDIGPAIGIYNELLEHADPRLRPLQRHVGYFKIVAHGKRKEYALAADEANRWLATFNTPDSLRSKEGLGVQLELAKDIIAQLPEIKADNDRAAAVKRIGDTLGTIVRYSSPFKAEALTLLKKYRPNAAANAAEVSKLTYEDAMTQGEQALAAREWSRASVLLAQAVRRAEGVDKLNLARYNLAFVLYMDKRYYEADVLAEHVARRYPKAGVARQAAEIGMASLAEAYNAYTQVDRNSDLRRLIDLATYTVATFPQTDQGDTARMTLGQIRQGTGKYDEAVVIFESVRANTPRWAEARTRSGAAHWQYSQALRAQGKTKEADAEVARALAVLDEALKARTTAGNPPTDPGYIGNICDIADIHLDTDRPDAALKVLDPVAKAQPGNASGTAYARLMATMLRAHVAASQVDLALTDMSALERTGAGAGMARLYLSLGKLFQKELDTLKKKSDTVNYNRKAQSYGRFLTALASSKSGQTPEALTMVGENMLALGNAKDAEALFRRILDTYGKDTKWLAQPDANARLLRARLRLVAALRDQHQFGEAESLLSQVTTEFPRAIEPMMEKGFLVEEKARAKKATWAAAFSQWSAVASRLGRAATKPVEYYDAWYHAALALREDGKPREARQTLASVMRLSRSVGSPEMKAKYQALLDQIK